MILFQNRDDLTNRSYVWNVLVNRSQTIRHNATAAVRAKIINGTDRTLFRVYFYFGKSIYYVKYHVIGYVVLISLFAVHYQLAALNQLFVARYRDCEQTEPATNLAKTSGSNSFTVISTEPAPEVFDKNIDTHRTSIGLQSVVVKHYATHVIIEENVACKLLSPVVNQKEATFYLCDIRSFGVSVVILLSSDFGKSK